MKKWMCAAFAALSATAAIAEERNFVCVSDVSGEETRVSRAAGGSKGQITTAQVTGETTVLKGLDNITFLYIEGQNVLTFVVDLKDMTYDLSIQGANAGNDRGTCKEIEA